VRDFYLEQSSGRYTVDGQVSEWIAVPFPESEYGGNSSDGAGSDNKHGQVYRLIRDTLDAMDPATAAGCRTCTTPSARTTTRSRSGAS
jgi:M6 family metalloprotease-like protein